MTLDDISVELGLDATKGDWGIENADADRLEEFVDYFERHHGDVWPHWSRAAFLDLVLESANDALLAAADGTGRTLPSCAREFIARVRDINDERYAYWSALPTDEFPVRSYLVPSVRNGS